jgi:hypothetical protein
MSADVKTKSSLDRVQRFRGRIFRAIERNIYSLAPAKGKLHQLRTKMIFPFSEFTTIQAFFSHYLKNLPAL